MKYVFYDFETDSTSTTWGQILEVGAILCNQEFEILDRYEARCRIKPGVIPEPMALIINKTSIEMLRKTNLSHFQFVNQLEQTFKSWSPAVFIGYNNISFDEEHMRKTFFKCLKDPYLTSFNGNSRGDILTLARSSDLYYPGSIKTPMSDKGNAVFKLDQLAPLNGIVHESAHTAMSDVIATLEMAKLLSNKAPNVWKASLMTTTKSGVQDIISKEKIFCTNEYFYGRARNFCVTYICDHPVYKWKMCFDLKNDASDFLQMDYDSLKEALSKSPKVIRSVKDNKSPLLMSANYAINFDGYRQIGMAKLHERAELLRNNEEFKKKVSRILEEEALSKQDTQSQESIMAEESIYAGGFAKENDKAVMTEFHKAEWKDKLAIADKFSEERFNYFAKKIIYEETPQLLPSDLYKQIHREVAKRVLSTNDEKWNTIPKSYKEIDDLRDKFDNEKDVEKLSLLEDINNYLMELEKEYKAA